MLNIKYMEAMLNYRGGSRISGKGVHIYKSVGVCFAGGGMGVSSKPLNPL